MVTKQSSLLSMVCNRHLGKTPFAHSGVIKLTVSDIVMETVEATFQFIASQGNNRCKYLAVTFILFLMSGNKILWFFPFKIPHMLSIKVDESTDEGFSTLQAEE